MEARMVDAVGQKALEVAGGTFHNILHHMVAGEVVEQIHRKLVALAEIQEEWACLADCRVVGIQVAKVAGIHLGIWEAEVVVDMAYSEVLVLAFLHFLELAYLEYWGVDQLVSER
jgi:hypothetical protein